MQIHQDFKEKVLNLQPEDFNDLALEVFRYQAKENKLYAQFIDFLGIKPKNVDSLAKIPFLPIEFFKSHQVLTGKATPQQIFESSGTTGQTTSKHYVADPDFYLAIAQQIFEGFYGKLADFEILALLPSYLERGNSSLVYMVDYFIGKTQSKNSGFFLNNQAELLERLNTPSLKKRLLIGVTFALLDLAECSLDLNPIAQDPHLIVMETGGMKGRRKELVREEAHQIMTQAFGRQDIHSEYGMTELLSQGYSMGEGIFYTPNSMKIFLRDVNDPLLVLDTQQATQKRSGGINVIDLANIDSCCFVATKDLGNFDQHKTGFNIIGRFDNSDVRGCNLMAI